MYSKIPTVKKTLQLIVIITKKPLCKCIGNLSGCRTTGKPNNIRHLARYARSVPTMNQHTNKSFTIKFSGKAIIPNTYTSNHNSAAKPAFTAYHYSTENPPLYYQPLNQPRGRVAEKLTLIVAKLTFNGSKPNRLDSLRFHARVIIIIPVTLTQIVNPLPRLSINSGTYNWHR
jgi:hypothetical protein